MPLSCWSMTGWWKGQSKRRQGERSAGSLQKLEERLQITPEWEDWAQELWGFVVSQDKAQSSLV